MSALLSHCTRLKKIVLAFLSGGPWGRGVVYWHLDILDATEEIYIVESETPIGEGR